MNSFQKVIKYVALALAFLIIGSLISMAFEIVSSVSDMFSNEKLTDIEERKIEDLNILDLDIDVSQTILKINKGTAFKVETNTSKIKVKSENGKLSITDKSGKYIKDKTVIVTIPENYKFRSVSIESGALGAEIEKIIAESVDFDMGAGKTVISELIVSNEIEIDGGAGEFIIENGSLNNLDFDMGVGRAEINADITGNSKIDSGVGKLEINLPSNVDTYRFKINKGIGSIKLNGENVSDGKIIGSGSSSIYIDGGVGTIDIKTL